MKLSLDALHTLNLMLKHHSAPFGLDTPSKPLEEVIKLGCMYLETNDYMKDGVLTESGERACVGLTLLINAQDFVKMEHTMVALDADISNLMICGYQLDDDGAHIYLIEGLRISFAANILKDSAFVIKTDLKEELDESWRSVNMTRFMLESRTKSGLHFEIYKNRELVDDRYILDFEEIVEVDVLGNRVRMLTPVHARKNIMDWLEVNVDETGIAY